MASRSPDKPRAAVTVRYEVPLSRDNWTLSEEPVPESQPHDLAVDLLKALLLPWAARAAASAPLQVARNLAVRWDESHPSVGVDPDVSVFERVPEGDDLTSLCTWLPGHAPPRLAVEVVSGSNARKDYDVAPDKYAASGTDELWVFDPKLAGPTGRGGPHRLQLWRRDDSGDFVRTYAGPGPVFSPAVRGWLLAVSEGQWLRIADDEAGTRWWTTAEEAALAAKEAALAAKEAALARVAELEAELELRRDARGRTDGG